MAAARRDMEEFDTSDDGVHANWPDQTAFLPRSWTLISPRQGIREGVSEMRRPIFYALVVCWTLLCP
jgi:hypothetical protein